MKTNRIQDLSQQRADFAFVQVKEVIELTDMKTGEFKSHVKKVPLMIRTSGLAATYAFVFSKRDEPKEKNGKAKPGNSYYHIEEISKKWLDQRNLLTVGEGENMASALSKESFNRDQYRRALRELLALFTWLKRFADGLIEKEEEDK